MTKKSAAKFEEKLTLNFNASSGKSEISHFDVLLLSTAYKVSAKKVQKNYTDMALKNDPNLEEKLTFCLKNEKFGKL